MEILLGCRHFYSLSELSQVCTAIVFELTRFWTSRTASSLSVRPSYALQGYTIHTKARKDVASLLHSLGGPFPQSYTAANLTVKSRLLARKHNRKAQESWMSVWKEYKNLKYLHLTQSATRPDGMYWHENCSRLRTALCSQLPHVVLVSMAESKKTTGIWSWMSRLPILYVAKCLHFSGFFQDMSLIDHIGSGFSCISIH